MSMELNKSSSNGSENSLTIEEHQQKINEVRRLIGPLSGKLSLYCSDASISRYLRARNWNVKKATKMLKETLKWRLEYKPDEIRWDEIAHEAETGKIYRSNYMDKHGRTVLVMRPGCQNSKSIKGQIRYLVYCMENAVMNLPQDQEQMVWLIDFYGFKLSNISVKVTRETAHVLQEHYPERLGVAILYNPPKFFEPFYKVVKPFLEPKTANKVKFVYSDNPETNKIMEEIFDTNQIESAFGGKDERGFDINKYAERMREDDKKMPLFWTEGNENEPAMVQQLGPATCLDRFNSESDSDKLDIKHIKASPIEEELAIDDTSVVKNGCSKETENEPAVVQQLGPATCLDRFNSESDSDKLDIKHIEASPIEEELAVDDTSVVKSGCSKETENEPAVVQQLGPANCLDRFNSELDSDKLDIKHIEASPIEEELAVDDTSVVKSGCSKETENEPAVVQQLGPATCLDRFNSELDSDKLDIKHNEASPIEEELAVDDTSTVKNGCSKETEDEK